VEGGVPSDVEAAAGALYGADNVAAAMGMTVAAVDVGTATLEMTVTEDMVNGLGVCHGGLIFTLADTAMAYGSNSGGESAFSTTATIEWLRPARVGDRLAATSTAIARRGRNCVHDVVVTNAAGEVIALVRAQTLAMNGDGASGAAE